MRKSQFYEKNKRTKLNKDLSENCVKGWLRSDDELDDLTDSELLLYRFLELFTLRMKQKREFLNYSKRDVAKITKIDEGYIGKIENGRATPTMETIFKICNALYIDIDVK